MGSDVVVFCFLADLPLDIVSAGAAFRFLVPDTGVAVVGAALLLIAWVSDFLARDLPLLASDLGVVELEVAGFADRLSSSNVRLTYFAFRSSLKRFHRCF